ncbi:hypothetical protein [Anoxybacillus sp. ST70]|uniref:hypothetical protein n=1 Tax=Anoxybacillus TaxID=150247 RepID=UPI001C6F851B|nr:hypothetical protein [Anoxybacillus sp. ST70]MBW9216937.1 hypothetical protein [Anoxybacillus sp. ST70]
MTDAEFFEAIGYLSVRNILIEAEVAEGAPSTKFEREYLEITGELVNGLPEYHKINDKWGKELRLYIDDVTNIPAQLGRELRSDNYKGYAGRINNNNLITRMFEYGFRVGTTQNVSLIRSKVPASFVSDFERGQNL